MSDKEIKNATKMEIINSEAHHRANIKFDGKPSEEVRTMMKNEGWLYSSKNNVWYPKNEAAFNSFEFAKQLQKDFFPEQKNDPEITDDSERQELINLISSKASLDTVISKLEELYGAKVVINATQKAVKNIENKAEIEVFCKELADKMIQTAYEASASGFNYYLSMEEVSRISGKDEAWLKAHIDNIQEALNEHWDNELLESEFDSNENSFNLNFYSIGHDANELFKKDENGRWVRKTDQELIQEGLLIKDDVFENQNPVDQIPTITKFNNIIQEAFFTLTDDDKENSITQEGKEKNYNMWYKAVCSNIMNEIQNGHAEICRLIDNFNFEDFNKNPNYSKSGKEYFVKQKLLVKCHEIIQDNKRKEFDENKTPYIELNWSESPVFPFENTVYSIKEFNDIIQNADKENRNRKDYAEKKYGSVESYWALEEAEQLPEEDKDIEFGYDKTSFKIFNLPNPENPEDTITYEPDRYDIGDGNGSIFDFIRTTCTYENIISVMNDIEQKIYQPDISETDKKLIDSIFEKEKLNLSENLKKSMNTLDEAQNNYNELHKSWIIEVNAAEKADNDLQEALNSVKETYEASIVNAYKEYYKSIELKNFSFEIPINIKKEQALEYLSNKANQMLVTSLYSDSKKAYESGKFNWDRQRKIWEQFPYNCNKKEYTDTLLESTFASIGFTVNNSVEKTPAESLTEEEIKQGKSEANRIRQENLRKKLEAEQGKNYDRSLSTTDIAKKLREYVKKNYPDYKFSIRSKYFSGGSEINVELMKSPVPITDYDSMKKWFDENAVRAGSHYSRWDDEQKKDFIKYYVESGRTFNISRHNFNDKFNLWMTPDVRKVMSDVVSQLESYNYDHSDSMTDYFNVNFYSDYGISKEAMTHSLELLKSRENVEEMEKRIDSGEIFGKSEKERKVDFATNKIIEKIKAAGIEVVTDKDEFNWTLRHLEEINITLEMLGENPLAVQQGEKKEIGNLSSSKNDKLTRSQSLYKKNTINSSNSQDIINNLDFLKNIDTKIDGAEFLIALKHSFYLDEKIDSNYVHENNNNIELRLSNHCANAEDSKRYNKSTSIVIKLVRGKNAPRFRKSPKADVVEFAYYPENLTLESEKAIINGLIDWVKTGEYTYTQSDEFHQSTRKEFIQKHKKSQKMTSTEYNNKEVDAFVTDKSGFVDPEKIAAIDLYGFEKAKKMWENGEPDWETKMMLQDKSISDYLNWKKPNIYKKQIDDTVYGFVHNGKIYLNPEIMNSNAAVHEYTHLWDAYTQKTNPELWNKGLEIFKDTKYWNEVISDPNYQDIKNDDNLVLSEIHSRICGDIAEKVLERIAELDGKQVKLEAIDWDKETWNYICEEMMQENKTINYSNDLNSFDLTEFLSTPMKDLIAENNILKTNSLEWTSVGNARDTDYTYYKNHSIERYFAGININNENTYSVKIDGVPLTFIDEETNEENKLYFSEKELDKQILNDTLYYGKSMDEINFDFNNKTSSIISEPSISYMSKKDPAVTRDIINQAKARRASYCHSVVKGEKKGLWKSFNEFQRHGVFDIQGQTLMTDKNGHLTDTGFKQLAISMDIYRDKRFESARYVFVDKDGTIKDQMALSTFMPNHSISKLDETFKQVMEHAEKTNTKIAFVHNHPSGNIEASYDDIQFTKELESYLNQDNKDLFLGHVILDHDTFNCYSPESKWNSVTFEHPGKDRFEKEVPDFAKTVIDGDKKLREIAQSINSTNEYNKDWIPVIFARENASVGGVEYFNKDFFIENDSNAIKNEFEKIGLLCGSDRAIPVVPNGMSYEPELHSEMINKFREGCFYDMALGNRTTTDLHLTKYSNEIFNYTQKEMEEMTKIESTFEPVKVSKKEVGVSSKVAENKTYYVRENIQPVNVKTLLEKHEDIPIFDHKYFVDQKFLPAFTFANNDVYVRCNAKNLAINSELKLNPEKKVDLILSKKQFAQIIATEKLKEKVARMHDFEVNNKAITPIVVAPNNMTALQQDLIFHQNNHLNYTERKEAFSSMYKEIMDNVKQIETKTLSTNQKTILDINQEFNKMQKPNSINSVQKTPGQEYDNSVDFGI